MADIELVIKIPEKEYQRWQKDGEMDALIVRNAIVNSTPLNKVLDNEGVLGEIKKEIDLLSDSKCNGTTITLYSWEGMKRKVFDIIDKYKTESEEV